MEGSERSEAGVIRLDGSLDLPQLQPTLGLDKEERCRLARECVPGHELVSVIVARMSIVKGQRAFDRPAVETAAGGPRSTGVSRAARKALCVIRVNHRPVMDSRKLT